MAYSPGGANSNFIIRISKQVFYHHSLAKHVYVYDMYVDSPQ